MTLPTTPSFRLDGKRALVVGGSSGIGLGCAVALAEHGARVTLGARDGGRMEQVAGEMRAKGWDVGTIVMDVSQVAETQAGIARTGPYDILVNSAGFARHSDALDTTEADFDLVTDINAKGAYFLAQAVAKGLIAVGKPGSIIQISSQMGHVGGRERAVYCGSKHALEGYTKAQAIEWGPKGILVNTISPTFIRTPLSADTFERPEMVAWLEDKIKLNRIGEVEDIMGATVLLASDAGAMITGTSLLIDGGWTAG